uniref:Lymphocyte antigen 75 n=1 Tax=Astyanax mexicanus TaxID=7994 RepID=A0A8B9J9R7_ASTMX
MDRAGRAVLGWLLCVVLGQSAVRCGGSGDGTFTIQHEGSRKCLQVQHGALVLGNCSAEPSCLWKWGSARRLFHTGSSACLGMYVPNKTLSLTSCLAEPQLQWYCNEGSLFTIYQMKLSATANGTVVAKREAPDSWIRGGTSENICQQMYQMMHTSGGNSLGAPCKFPFLYNGTWHHRCLPADDVHPPDWCSTKDSYDQDQQWGTCLKYEEGCGALWNISRNGRCYQVISTALVTWHEARDSCRTQGGDLLSVSSSEDLQICSELPEKLWIGLNRLDWLQGWQWSDGSPLAYIPWNAGIYGISVVRNYGLSHFLIGLCLFADKMMYKSTVCDDGWTPQGGFCYKLYGNESSMYKTYADAQKVCLENGAQLASIHSLGDVELLNTDFSAVSNVWIGLKAVKNTDLFKWEDGTNVSFTYWGRTQPPLLSSTTDSCVKTSVTAYCKLIINNRFEQAFINSLLKEHIGSESLFFWTGLQDSKGTGEYQWFSPSEQKDRVTYTNWRWPEPANTGGCAVMSTASPLGQWFVKNCTVFKAGSICKRLVSPAPPVPAPEEPNINATCPQGWVSRDGMKYCYKVFHEERLSRKRSWEEAELFCEALGAHLPSFTELNEMTGLHNILRDSISDDRFFWVGFNRRNPNNDNSWEWSDGRPVMCICSVAYIPGITPKNPEWYNPDGHHNTSVFIDGQEFWFVNQPQLSFEEAIMYCSSNSSRLATPNTINAARLLQEHLYKMYLHQPEFHHARYSRINDEKNQSLCTEYRKGCEVKQPFVCETLNVTSAETGTQDPEAPAKPCEEGTLAFRDKCFTVTKPGYMSFKQANERCHTLRGTLLSVRDQAEQDFITTLLPGLPRKLWIGLKLRQHDTQWVDKSDVKYLNFNPLLHGQLRPMYIYTFEQDGLELCAYMFNNAHSDMLGTWDYTSCSHEQSLIKLEKNTSSSMFIYNLNWIDAWDLCKSNNMDLASVSDAYLQAVLTVNVSKVGHPLWIGLFSEDEHYRWTDHSHTVFSRWSDEVTAGRCVYLDTDGFWKATECGRQLGGAICHCLTNKIVISFLCFFIICLSAGMGDILTIRSEEENEFIRTQLQPYADLASFVWLGIYKANGSQLKWYDDTNVQYSNWKNGRPDVPPLFMAGLNMNGEWDLIDSYFSSFKQNAIVVCKIERDSKTEFQLSQSDVKAPPGYTFRLIPKKLNWYQALEECSSDGGHLVSIHSEEANKDMALITKRDGFPHWIGLSRQDFSGWPFEWSDGTSLQFQPQGFEVLGVGSEEQCVYVDPEGRWSAVNCHAKLEGAICYKTVNKSQMSAHSSDNCPKSDGKASWIQFEDHCYAIDMTLYNYSVYSMVDAQRICETLDPTSQLLTIKSEEENDFVSRHVAENPLITSRVWLALKSAVGESWMDGSALGFSNWGHTQPQSGCAVLVAVNGSWNNASCMNSRSRVVCKAPLTNALCTMHGLATPNISTISLMDIFFFFFFRLMLVCFSSIESAFDMFKALSNKTNTSEFKFREKQVYSV